MKQLIPGLLIISFACMGWMNRSTSAASNPIEIRSGAWPILLQRNIGRSDTTYSLQFRDAKVLSGTVMDTLTFADLSQLKYFEKALTVLKKGNNGDIAKFKNYSIKRADKKYEGVWYMLEIKWGFTDFKQPEADLLVKTINGLKF